VGEDSGKARSGLLDRLEFPKAILEVAGETVKAERRIKANEEQDRVIAAWQELFHEVKSQKTHRIVERIVADIDGIVQNLWFPGWQKTFLDSQRHPPSELPRKHQPHTYYQRVEITTLYEASIPQRLEGVPSGAIRHLVKFCIALLTR
jgi:hypothetical protein